MTDAPPPPSPPPAPPKPKRPRPVGSASRATPPRRTPAPAAPVVPPRPHPFRGIGLAAALTFAADQALKWFVVQHLDLANLAEIEVLDPWLNLRMAWNEGINFGLFASGADVMRWVLVAIALAVCAWVAVWAWRARPGRFGRIAAGLLIGGALGNVVDRIAYGAVADFLNMSLPGWRNPFSFNIADIAIFAGAFGLVLMPGHKPRDDAAAPR